MRANARIRAVAPFSAFQFFDHSGVEVQANRVKGKKADFRHFRDQAVENLARSGKSGNCPSSAFVQLAVI
jgi:hypothetical protein